MVENRCVVVTRSIVFVSQTWQEAAESEIEHNVVNGWQVEIISV